MLEQRKLVKLCTKNFFLKETFAEDNSNTTQTGIWLAVSNLPVVRDFQLLSL